MITVFAKVSLFADAASPQFDFSLLRPIDSSLAWLTVTNRDHSIFLLTFRACDILLYLFAATFHSSPHFYLINQIS